MYSHEDRIRTVLLYLKLGKCIRATIRQLGYPTKNSLLSRHRENAECRTEAAIQAGARAWPRVGGLTCLGPRQLRARLRTGSIVYQHTRHAERKPSLAFGRSRLRQDDLD
jgi:hypothetical protein